MLRSGLLRFGLLLVGAGLGLPSLTQAPDPGPHVIWSGEQAQVTRIIDGQVKRESRKGAFELSLPGLSPIPLKLGPGPQREEPGALPEPERILAISDLHGEFTRLRSLLVAQGVVDATLHWRFGAGHLVVVGDTLDRGAQVTECLWFLRALQEQARAAGGRVHVLLGNHEHMVLKGDWRYVHNRYRLTAPGLPSLAEQFSLDSELGRWIRERPLMLRLGRFLFVHGGPGPAFREAGLSLIRSNASVRKALVSGERDEVATFLLGGQGPLWYRGLVPGASTRDLDSEGLDALLKQLEVWHFVVGHTSLKQITSFHDGRVFAIDAGIQEGRAGEAWIWNQGKVWRGLSDGTRVLLSGPVPPVGR